MADQSGTKTGKPLAWKLFGIQQKSLRNLRGLTQPQLAALTAHDYSLSKVQKVEAGNERPTPEYVQDIDDALEAEGILVAQLEELAKPGHPVFFQEYADAEERVQRLYKYDAHSINGLLQTEAHANTVLSARIPLLEDDAIEERIRGRIDRQKLLTRKPSATLCFVIEEHILRRPIGGPMVHRQQLEHLAACAGLRTVSLHVMPTDVDTHVGLDGPLTLLTTEEGQSAAYVEYQGGGSTFYVAPKELDALEQRYAMIRSQALPAKESLAFIEKLAGEL
ncbi:helix-turn-helix domain-containing protein [Streptomyces sp. NPDC051561]|uniref:helix-turn-helix domain-containing protein n=1 Tax=Streptomyces sp. NPDC051561 TaxID=3365658 RepID=UPI0037998ECD